jgi:hypothetical protein
MRIAGFLLSEKELVKKVQPVRLALPAFEHLFQYQRGAFQSPVNARINPAAPLATETRTNPDLQPRANRRPAVLAVLFHRRGCLLPGLNWIVSAEFPYVFPVPCSLFVIARHRKSFPAPPKCGAGLLTSKFSFSKHKSAPDIASRAGVGAPGKDP